jgi:hypothetical protein
MAKQLADRSFARLLDALAQVPKDEVEREECKWKAARAKRKAKPKRKKR